MVQKGKVISTYGDTAKVLVMRQSACDGCHKNCGMCSEGKPFVVTAANEINAKPDDSVLLEFPDNKALLWTILTYFIPSVLSILGAAIAFAFTENNAIAAAAFFSGAAVCLILTVWIGRKAANKNKLKIRITEKI